MKPASAFPLLHSNVSGPSMFVFARQCAADVVNFDLDSKCFVFIFNNVSSSGDLKSNCFTYFINGVFANLCKYFM